MLRWGKWPQLCRRIPAEVFTVLQRLQSGGYQAYLVGGAPRDLLRGCPPQDWDIATDARPEEVKALFDRTIALGEKFGTVGVLIGDQQLEVTTFRQEGGYSDGRRPDWVEFTPDLVADLARRDFTKWLAMDSRGVWSIHTTGWGLETTPVKAVANPPPASEDCVCPLHRLSTLGSGSSRDRAGDRRSDYQAQRWTDPAEMT